MHRLYRTADADVGSQNTARILAAASTHNTSARVVVGWMVGQVGGSVWWDSLVGQTDTGRCIMN